MKESDNNKPSNNKSSANPDNSSRRGALKKAGTSTIAVGVVGSLPKTWKSPMVESVLLPAHGDMTVTTQCFFYYELDPPVTIAGTVCLPIDGDGCFQEYEIYPPLTGTGTICLPTTTAPP